MAETPICDTYIYGKKNYRHSVALKDPSCSFKLKQSINTSPARL